MLLGSFKNSNRELGNITSRSSGAADAARLTPALCKRNDMENPDTFDVFVGVVKERRAEEVDWIIQNLGLNRTEAIRNWLSSCEGEVPLLVGVGLGWNKANAIKVSASKFFSFVDVYVNTLGPTLSSNFCDVHSLYFGVSSVCPVCSGWYLDQDENGTYIKPKIGGSA